MPEPLAVPSQAIQVPVTHFAQTSILMLPFPATFISTPAPLSLLTSTATLTSVFVCMLFTQKLHCNNSISCLHYKQFLHTKQHKNCYCNKHFDSYCNRDLRTKHRSLLHLETCCGPNQTHEKNTIL